MTSTATPAVRKTAAELGVDLGDVVGTGAGGRITVADVRRTTPRQVNHAQDDVITDEQATWIAGRLNVDKAGLLHG